MSDQGTQARGETAAGYRGPGTDLGEDIRRGNVTREGERPADDAEEHGRPAGWGGRLRARWSAPRRAPK